MNKKSDADLSIAGPSKDSNISSTEYTSSSCSSFVAPTAKKRKTQVFREAWLQNPTFKLWLKQTDDPHKAKCTACSKLLTAHKNNLYEHARSDSHMMNLQQNAGASISVLSNATASSSNKENNSSSDSSFVAPTAKKGKTQVFREAWLQNPIFKLWLKQTDDPRKAKCTACSKLLTAHKNNLEEHAKSYSHMMNVQQNAGASISVLSNAAASSSNKENNSSADVSIDGPSSAACLISNGDSDSSSDSILFIPAAKKRKTKKQAFREAWLEEPIFKPWLKQADDPHKAKCTACSKVITAHKRFLELHAKSDIHIMNMIYQKEPGTTATKKTKRLPFNKTYLYSLDFLQPDVALDLNKHRKNHLDKILKTFKSKFNETAVLNEWFNLAAYSTEENKPKLLKLNIIEFWEHISTVQDVSGEYEFKNISTLAQLCLLQPHSNADVERYFSCGNNENKN